MRMMNSDELIAEPRFLKLGARVVVSVRRVIVA